MDISNRELSFWEELTTNFIHLPLFIQIAVGLIFLSVFSTLTAYLAIVVGRWNAFIFERRKAWILPKINDLVMNQVLLNEQLTNGVRPDQIEFDEEAVSKPAFRRKWVKQIMIDTIIDYRKNLRGETGELLRKLYIEMGLEKQSSNKLKSVQWHKKIKGLLELTKMDIPISDVTILPLTNSKTPQLRVAARNAYIQLSKNEPFKFFDVATEPLLPWDQLELFRIITTTKDISIPNFSRWVNYSTNKSIISFCLKLIAHYNQQNAIPAVMTLVETKDHMLRADAISCLGKLGAKEAEEKLVGIYNHQPLNCQLEVLNAVGNIGSGRYTDFLKHEFLFSSSFDVRMRAAKALFKYISPDNFIIRQLMDSATAENLTILKHASNPLIKN